MPSAREDVRRLLDALAALPVGEIQLMEVCGTHTMSIAQAGIKSMLPGNIRLLSGPGCPVCVTPPQVIDAVLALSMEKDVIIASYGDMLRVPGSRPGDSLLRRRALGAKVQTVYSPVDAVKLAQERPDRQIVFLGVGFETTAPGTAAAMLTAQEAGVKNFTLWSMLKTVEPALRALIAMDGFHVDGFLCPGHVATILGADAFRFLPEEYGLPAVVAGFETGDLLTAVYRLLCQIRDGKPALENEYIRAVSPEGNPAARALMSQVLEERPDIWRGLGAIQESGFGLKAEFQDYDAARRFDFRPRNRENTTGCHCGAIICGQMSPQDCPLFGKRCQPDHPVGPCMVSGEGACAAAYHYRRIE